MDPRNYESGAAGSPPAAPATPSTGFPTAGDPQTATPATKPGAHWYYKIGESLRKIITDAGLTPDDADLGQLKTALVSPQSDVDTGADDNRFVTPKKLRWGFSASLTTNGYIVLPTWLSGLIFQWGSATIQPNNTVTLINLPISFTTAGFQIVSSVSGLNTATFNIGASLSGLTQARFECNHSQNVGCRYFVIGH